MTRIHAADYRGHRPDACVFQYFEERLAPPAWQSEMGIGENQNLSGSLLPAEITRPRDANAGGSQEPQSRSGVRKESRGSIG